jgi:hypothetical protein
MFDVLEAITGAERFGVEFNGSDQPLLRRDSHPSTSERRYSLRWRRAAEQISLKSEAKSGRLEACHA